jgi:S-adenosylmethionine synthetase
MPLALDLSINYYKISHSRRENNEIPYLRPDAKSQVTLEYSDDNKPTRIDAIVISTQHDDFDEESIMLAKIKKKILYRF